MLINPISDLHNEWSVFEPPPVRADLRVVTGDIDSWRRPDVLVRMLDLPTLAVLGNHDMDGTTIEEAKAAWEETTVLTNELATRQGRPGRLDLVTDCGVRFIDGVRFVCATLWTDMDGGDPLTMHRLSAPVTFMRGDTPVTEPLISDFGRIKDFTPEVWLSEHARHRAFIDETLCQPWDGPTALLTHHLASHSLIPERYRGDKANAGYASNLNRWFGDAALVYFHGHIHTSHQVQLGETRSVCNPRGYNIPDRRMMPNPDFDPTLIIEI